MADSYVWYVRVTAYITSEFKPHGQYTTCVEVPNQKEAERKAIQQVRESHVPDLSWGVPEIVDPKPNCPPSHDISVQYTTDDDGIHVCCECGWTKCLGYSPTPEQVMEASREHTREIQGV